MLAINYLFVLFNFNISLHKNTFYNLLLILLSYFPSKKKTKEFWVTVLRVCVCVLTCLYLPNTPFELVDRLSQNWVWTLLLKGTWTPPSSIICRHSSLLQGQLYFFISLSHVQFCPGFLLLLFNLIIIFMLLIPSQSKAVPVHALKGYQGSGGITPLIFNPNTRLKWVVKFMCSQSWYFEEKYVLSLLGFEPWIVQCIA